MIIFKYESAFCASDKGKVLLLYSSQSKWGIVFYIEITKKMKQTVHKQNTEPQYIKLFYFEIAIFEIFFSYFYIIIRFPNDQEFI